MTKVRDDDQLISSVRISGRPVVVPALPTHLEATLASGGVELSWTKGADPVDGHWVFRRVAGESDDRRIASLPADATSFTDKSPVAGVANEYQVQSFLRSDGYSPRSEPANVTP